MKDYGRESRYNKRGHDLGKEKDEQRFKPFYELPKEKKKNEKDFKPNYDLGKEKDEQRFKPSNDLPKEKKEDKCDKIDWSKDTTEKKKDTKWDKIDWSKDTTEKKKDAKWDKIDWSKDTTEEKKDTKWDTSDWNKDTKDNNSQEKKIEGYKNDYINEDVKKIVDFQDKNEMIDNKINSIPRKELIEKFKDIFKKEFPNGQFSDFNISRILYNNPKFIKDDFLHIRKIRANSRPDLLVLMKIIYHTQNLTITDKVKLKNMRGITSQTLNKIKGDLRKTIVDFVFDNPYKIKYIKQDNRAKHQRETDFWRPEFNVFLDLWYAASLNNNGPISIKTFQQTIGNPAFSTPTKIGKCNTKYFYKLFKKLPSLFPNLSQESFKQVHQNLKKYIKMRHLSETYKDYSIYWDDEITKKAQITTLLLRDLGVEILTLRKIPSISFNKNLDLHDPKKYQRHHIFTNDKDSIDPNRLVLAVLISHTSLEGLTDLTKDLIRQRIKWNSDCPKFYQNNAENAQQLWQEFLKRGDVLKNEGIEYFFRTYYPDVVNRFYKNVPKGDLELKIKQLIQEWINDGNPEIIFPKYLLNRFGC